MGLEQSPLPAMTNTPPTPQEIISLEESKIDFSSSGFKRYRFIDKTYRAFMKAKPQSTEAEAYSWIRQMIRKLDSGVKERDLPSINPTAESEALREIGWAIEEGKRRQVKEALDLLAPDIRYIKQCDPNRGRQLESSFIAEMTERKAHPATVLLEWRPRLQEETTHYENWVREYLANLEVAE
jgi:hypothetical protein